MNRATFPAAAVQLGDLPDRPAAEPASGLEERDELLTALRALPKGQRAVIVLRYLSDLSVEQTAEALGRSAGNVKSQCSRCGRPARRRWRPGYCWRCRRSCSGATGH